MMRPARSPPSLLDRSLDDSIDVNTMRHLDLSLQELNDLPLEDELQRLRDDDPNPRLSTILNRLMRRREFLRELKRQAGESGTEGDYSVGHIYSKEEKGNCDSFLRNRHDCAICLAALEKNVTCLPCGHVFHSDCLREWYDPNQNMYNEGDRCPLCREVYLGDRVLVMDRNNATWEKGSISWGSEDIRPIDLDL